MDIDFEVALGLRSLIASMLEGILLTLLFFFSASFFYELQKRFDEMRVNLFSASISMIGELVTASEEVVSF